MEEYTAFEQQFGEGDVVEYEGYKYIIREVSYDEEFGYWYYIEEANTMGHLDNMPVFAEVAQADLKPC